MKKLSTKVLALTIAMLMVFAAGCGNGTAANSAPPASQPAASQATTASQPAASQATTASQPAASQAAPATATKDTLIIATENETPSMTTNGHNAVAGSYMNDMTHNGLFQTDVNLNPVPVLCKEFKNLSPTEWEFTIYDNIKFHDGTACTAEDVKASLDEAKNHQEVVSTSQTSASVEVTGPYTVKVITDGPQANLLYDLSAHGNYILPKALIDAGNDFNANPIGTGPYKFVKWTLGERIEFTAFDDYFDPAHKAKIKNVTWKTIPEGASRTIALEAGEADLVIEVATTDFKRISENSKLKYVEVPSMSHNFMMVNNELAPFNNADFRKGLNAAINKEDIVSVALDEHGMVAISCTPANVLGSSDKNAQVYDPEAAKAFFEASGIDLASVTIDLICSNDTKMKAGQVIQANLADFGINVNLVSMDLATYLSVTATGDYQAAIGGYTSNDLLTYCRGVYHSSSINASNKTRLNDPKVDELINGALAEMDTAKRGAILEELSAHLNTVVSEVPIYQNTMIRAFSADLDGVSLSPAGTLPINDIFWTK